MAKLSPEQEQALVRLEEVGRRRVGLKKQADEWLAQQQELLKHDLAIALAEAYRVRLPKTRMNKAYGTKDPYTVARVAEELLDTTGAVPVPKAHTNAQGAVTATPAQPATHQDPPPPTRYENEPQWSATRESEGFVRVTLNNYPNPRTGEPVNVDNYLFSYEVKKTAPNLPRRLALRAADEREAPEGLTVVTSSFEFRDAVAEALGIEV